MCKYVSPTAKIGKGCQIGENVSIGDKVELGDNCKVENNVFVEKGARIGARTQVGYNTYVGSGVTMGEDNVILPSSTFLGTVFIGSRNEIGPYAAIGHLPQHKARMQSPGIIQIGDDNVLREFVTVHMPMEALTWIGNSCYIMAYNHFPHDVFVEDDVNMTNNCQIAGYSTIMHHVNLGLSSVAHQHSVIGAGAMIGMASVIVKDVPPYVVFINGVATRVNQVGLERMGKSEDEIRDLFQWYSGQRHNKLELADDLSSRWWYKDMKRFIELTKREMCPIGFAG